jgi:hypothetical protein
MARKFSDLEAFCRGLDIRHKDGTTTAMNWWPSQAKLAAAIRKQEQAGKPVRVVGLKSRRVGWSALASAYLFRKTAFLPGQSSWVFAHVHSSCQDIFGYYDGFDQSYRGEIQKVPTTRKLKPSQSSPGRLEFGAQPGGSYIQTATAGNVDVGRSTSIRHLVLDEYAFYRDAPSLSTGVLQCVPEDPDTTIIVLSTANGVGGPFYDLWRRTVEGSTDWVAVFFAWWEHHEYQRAFSDPLEASRFQDTLTREEGDLQKLHNLTLEQLHWRRWAIANKCEGSTTRFHQEYPACLTAETRVSTELGIIPIGEAAGARDTESGAVRAWGPQPVATVYKLTTRAGRIIRGTFDHPVATPSGFVFLSRLQPGQTVLLRPPRFAEQMHVQRWRPIPGAETRVTINEDWGAFLGYFMGDGSWHKDTLSVVCDGKDPDVVADVESLLGRLIGPPRRRTIRRVQGRKGAVELRLGSRRARETLRELGLLYRNDGGEGSWKRRVHVPECVFRSPRNVVRSFLRALFECDGSASGGRVRFGSAKLDFIRDIQLLLLGFGINSAIFSQPKKAGGGQVYQFYSLELGVVASRLFHDEIGFVGRRKTALRPVERAIGRRPQENSLTDVVLSVEMQGPEVTYDLTVEPDHVFSANGILTHNTPEEAFITSGRPRFDLSVLARQPIIREPLVGELTRQRIGVREIPVFGPRADGLGAMRLFKRPAEGHGYVLGADPSQGIDVGEETGTSDPDFSVACVLDADTGEQVAVVRERFTPTVFGEYVCALAEWYNWAFVVPEAVDPSLVQEILRFQYPIGKVYVRHRLADERALPSLQHVGFKTTTIARQQLISGLERALFDNSVFLHDAVTQQELHTFVYKANGRVEHQTGCHDDCVIALALAVVGLEATPRVVPPKRTQPIVRYGRTGCKRGQFGR